MLRKNRGIFQLMKRGIYGKAPGLKTVLVLFIKAVPFTVVSKSLCRMF